ncbi:S8 family serine peptidase [Ferruginibacter sp.]
MANAIKTSGAVYTYRGGKKILLDKAADEFITRALPEELDAFDTEEKKQVSSASTKVIVEPAELDTAMEESRLIAPTHHAYYLKGTKDSFFVTDRILVTFKTTLPAAKIDQFAAKYSLLQLEKYTDKDYLFQLTQYTGMNPVKLIVQLTENEPLVEYVENDLNQQVKTYALSLPTDPIYAKQWHLHNHFVHADLDSRSCSRCEEAWLILDNYGSSNVVVGVTDDGCKLNHPDFDSLNKFGGWGYMRGTRLINNSDIDASPAQMYLPGVNHGTSCAGVIGGEVDASLTVGAAPGCKLFPVQWESDGPSLFISDSKFLTVLNYVADKVDILSNSWGGVPRSLWSLQVVDKITQLAQTGGRRGKGIVFLFAAGNENCPISHTSTEDVPYTDGIDFQNNQWVWVGVETSKRFVNNFVGITGVMHVAALGSTAQRSHYSNYGTGIGICAPSSNSHEYHRMTVKGLGISTAQGTPSGVTASFGGTSSATPLVAGIAALVISANNNLTAAEVIAVLKQTASKDLNMTGYAKTPAANYDPNTSWDISPVAPFDKGDFKNIGSADGTWSPWFGHGKVDAFAAVIKAAALSGHNGHANLKIISALVNPSGDDYGNEKISMLNSSAQSTNLSGWSFLVKGRKQVLSGQINGGEAITVKVDPSKMALSNKGATISLLDPQGNKIQDAVYKAADVKVGEAVVF